MPVVDDLERARVLGFHERHEVLVGEALEGFDVQVFHHYARFLHPDQRIRVIHLRRPRKGLAEDGGAGRPRPSKAMEVPKEDT